MAFSPLIKRFFFCCFFSAALPFAALGNETDRPDQDLSVESASKVDASSESDKAPLPRSLIIPDASKLQIKTPSFKDQKTIKIRLENGLEAYLVSDPSLKESGAMLAVQTGAWNDPDEHAGMAHFIEHMLFINSEKYPEPDGFFHFVGEHGGGSNAYTCLQRTCYIFSISNDALSPALDRFGHFFISPKFEAEYLEREKNAVNSEWKRQFEHDGWRCQNLERSLSPKNHPMSRFSTGNLDSLKNIDRNVALHWYKAHYTPEKMRLIVYSTQPLGALKRQVEKIFSQIPMREVENKTFSSVMLTNERKAQIAYLEPKQERKYISLRFDLPVDLAADRDCRPDRLLSVILANSNSGSLLRKLKDEGLAIEISSNKDIFSQEHAQYIVDIELTDEGAKEHLKVVSYFFEAVAAIKQQDTSNVFSNLQTSDRLFYEYQSQQPIFSKLMGESHSIFYEDLATYPQKARSISHFDQKQFDRFMDVLRPHDAAILVCAQNEFVKKELSNKVPIYDIPYALEPISVEVRNSWSNAKPMKDFELPKKNPYFPSDEAPATTDAQPKQSAPLKIAASDHGASFHIPDRYFHLPKVSVSLRIRSPKTMPMTSKQKALLRLTLNALNEQLQVTSEEANEAGIESSLTSDSLGIRMRTTGWKEGSSKLMQQYLEALKRSDISQEEFAKAKQRELLSLRAMQRQAPIYQAMQLSRQIMIEKTFSAEEVERSMRSIQFTEFSRYTKEWLKEAYIECVSSGQLNQEEADKLKTSMISALGAKAFPISQHLDRKYLQLSSEKGPYIVREKRASPGNVCMLHIQDESTSRKNELCQQIVTKALSAGFFEELRTVQQTGYVAHAGVRTYESKPATVFFVESTTHSPDELLGRFELFIESFLSGIDQKFTKDSFNAIRSSLVTDYSKSPRDLSEESERYFYFAFEKNQNFKHYEETIEILEKLKYEEVKAYAKTFFGRQNRLRMAVFIEGQTPGVLGYETAKGARAVQRHGNFMSQNQADMFKAP